MDPLRTGAIFRIKDISILKRTRPSNGPNESERKYRESTFRDWKIAHSALGNQIDENFKQNK
jgi:hypothetical protein